MQQQQALACEHIRLQQIQQQQAEIIEQLQSQHAGMFPAQGLDISVPNGPDAGQLTFGQWSNTGPLAHQFDNQRQPCEATFHGRPPPQAGFIYSRPPPPYMDNGVPRAGITHGQPPRPYMDHEFPQAGLTENLRSLCLPQQVTEGLSQTQFQSSLHHQPPHQVTRIRPESLSLLDPSPFLPNFGMSSRASTQPPADQISFSTLNAKQNGKHLSYLDSSFALSFYLAFL